MSASHPSEAEGRTPTPDDQLDELREYAIDHMRGYGMESRLAIGFLTFDALLAARSPAPSDDADVINAIIEVLYDGDSPNVTDVEAAARHNPANMARCYAKILGIISAHGIAGLEADALDTLQSSRALLPPEKT